MSSKGEPRILDPEEEGLTPRQLAWVEEYCVDRNATQAAIRAGYSKRAARQQGSRLLSNAAIARAIERRLERITEEVRETAVITRQEILAELRELCFSDPDAFEVSPVEGVRLKEGVSKRMWRAVSGIEIRGGNNPGAKVIFHDKLAALRLAGDPLGMWKEKEIPADELGRLTNAQLEALAAGESLDKVRKLGE